MKCIRYSIYRIIPLLLFCQNLGQIGPVVQEKTQKNEIFRYDKKEVLPKTSYEIKSRTQGRHATETILPDGIWTNDKKHCVGMKKIDFSKLLFFVLL